MRIELGKCFTTAQVAGLIPAKHIQECLAKINNCDFGILHVDDVKYQKELLANGDDKTERMMGKYRVLDKKNKYQDLYVITEYDRSVTTVMLTDEY